MAPLGSFIRLTPLQLEELPSHPSLETLFSTPYSRNGTRPKSHPQALKDVSNALQDIPQSQSNAQQDHSYNLKNDSEAPTGNPVNSNGTSEDLRDGLHTLGPSHSDVLDHTGRPNLIPFIKTILDEATTFVDETITSTFSDGGLKSSPPSIAKVKLLKRTIAGSELSQIPWEKSTIARKPPQGIAKSSEAWFARSSKHANRNLKGTTSWSEIDFALRSDHSQHERMYTPDVFDDFKVLEWDFGAGHESIIGKYSDITMGIYEMCHKLPFPLAPRVFAVLVITARTGMDGFVVVQIPVTLESLPEAFYSNGRNLKEGGSALQKKKPVLGVYTSIERCIVHEYGNDPLNSEIIWMMATASDAKGWLPMWMQKLGVPGAVIKDVGLVIKWLQGLREEFQHAPTAPS